MDWSGYFAKFTMWVFAGAIVGVLVGLILMWADVVENPFYAMAVGIFVGAMFMPFRQFIRPKSGEKR